MAQAQRQFQEDPSSLPFERPATLSGRSVILKEEDKLPWLHLTRSWWEETFKTPEYSGKGYRVEFDDTVAPADHKVVIHTPSGQGQMHVTPDTHEFHGDAQSDNALIRHALQETATREPISNIIKADGEPDFMFRTWCHAQSMGLILENYSIPDLNNLSDSQQKIYDELKSAGMNFPGQVPQGGTDPETLLPKKASIGAATSPNPANALNDQLSANDSANDIGAIDPAVAAAAEPVVDTIAEGVTSPAAEAPIEVAAVPVAEGATVAAPQTLSPPARSKLLPEFIVKELAQRLNLDPNIIRDKFKDQVADIARMQAEQAWVDLERLAPKASAAEVPAAEVPASHVLPDKNSFAEEPTAPVLKLHVSGKDRFFEPPTPKNPASVADGARAGVLNAVLGLATAARHSLERGLHQRPTHEPEVSKGMGLGL